jgi:hypothetical protein
MFTFLHDPVYCLPDSFIISFDLITFTNTAYETPFQYKCNTRPEYNAQPKSTSSSIKPDPARRANRAILPSKQHQIRI